MFFCHLNTKSRSWRHDVMTTLHMNVMTHRIAGCIRAIWKICVVWHVSHVTKQSANRPSNPKSMSWCYNFKRLHRSRMWHPSLCMHNCTLHTRMHTTMKTDNDRTWNTIFRWRSSIVPGFMIQYQLHYWNNPNEIWSCVKNRYTLQQWTYRLTHRCNEREKKEWRTSC